MRGYTHPAKYQIELSKETTTAVRVTQIYSEATHIVVVGIGFVSLGILAASIGRLLSNQEGKTIFERLFDRMRRNQKDSPDE